MQSNSQKKFIQITRYSQKMSIDQLKELGKQLIDLSKSSDICANLIERSLENLRDYFMEPNEDQRIFSDFDNILPPQIQSSNGSEQITTTQPSIYGQTLLPPVMGNQVNPFMMQAQHVPFLFHNQQI
ncbi:hypothetical protein M9Y10_012389 [Tritrichomonas musculus]|uniref:Uncharacterized protein n=1 Tax=Tritrichomonas musculus TaxID=1915356 RepID=A0ABR2ICC9_9EUKA